jgi:signal transduction histidine kinase
LRRLADTAQRVGEGELGLQVTAPAQRGELGIAVREFNKMSTRLRELDAHAQAMRQRKYLSELGEIANGLAHTIRNPLNTLGLSVEQMAAPELAPDLRREMAHTARQQIRRIDQWIRSFLALASQGVAREDALHIDSLIQDVVLEIAQDGAREVELQVELTEDVPAFPGVAPELRAVLQALVVNAVEASPPGGVVRIETSAADHELCIRVADEGPGLPEVVRGKLFTPHVTTKETGSGMGLFLAHRIITSRYDGAVTLSDRPEGGTVAAISIPLQRSGDYV